MGSMKIDFEGFDEMLKKFQRLEADTKSITEEALRKTHEIVTAKAAASATAGSYPAGGKYSSGNTAKSLKKDAQITWKGTEASVEVGFNIKHGGLPSIFMMYGTPRYMKDQAMYDAFWSSQTEGEVINAQKEIFMKALEELQ